MLCNKATKERSTFLDIPNSTSQARLFTYEQQYVAPCVSKEPSLRGWHQFYFTTKIHTNTVQPSLKFKKPCYLHSFSSISSCLLFPSLSHLHFFKHHAFAPLRSAEPSGYHPLPFSCYQSRSAFIFFSTLDLINLKIVLYINLPPFCLLMYANSLGMATIFNLFPARIIPFIQKAWHVYAGF